MVSLSSLSNITPEIENDALGEVDNLDQQLHCYFQTKFVVQPSLTRFLVSFQANKTRPIYRWYKYKEAFSASLVELLCHKYGVTQGKILDPFAGSGTALFAASDIGIDADGIELLPIGQQIIDTKKLLEAEFTPNDFARLKTWLNLQVWKQFEKKVTLPELRITKGAYSQETKTKIEQYLGACFQENTRIQAVLRFAVLCVLESVSYTRKDGQYLRWDYRSGRGQGKKLFNKGEILEFNNAITNKINEIINDLEPSTQQIELFPITKSQGQIDLRRGSCLQILPYLPDATYDAVITSPPYCNRYDYTRTYALELALLGISEKELINLRQEMLSCTVENRPKDLFTINQDWKVALNVADSQALLQAILRYLDNQKSQGVLNNNGIPRMVRGYFYEMACVIQECFRVLKPGAFLFMVNDNVRYAGASVSVDMILSDVAEKLGFAVESILVLPGDKGNIGNRTLIYNLTVPLVRSNVDLCLFSLAPTELVANQSSTIDPSVVAPYVIALGELKGGIDPAGADEHWKTAQAALNRIREAFSRVGNAPLTFFVGAAVARRMAGEIWSQLENGTLSNAANLNEENQVASISRWLCNL